MNLERAAMKGKLAGLKEDRRRLRLKAEGLCSAIRAGLNIALADVEEIDVAMTGQQMDDLTQTMGELAAIQGQISRLEKELG